MTETATLGLYGLGTMGSALALNILDKGFALHVANRSPERTQAFTHEAQSETLADKLHPADDVAAMVQAMPQPRAIILMVPAGAAVDSTIEALAPLLSEGDTIIDAGNADFHETRRRTKQIEGMGLTFIGMGVSGGEDGARHGPSIMVGGTPNAWAAIRPVIEAIAAKFGDTPCADHFGPDGAGHFVKTVHNGIEYADMQLIAEVYGLMRYGMEQPAAMIGETFARWNGGPLESYLIEITAKILAATDQKTGAPAVDVITDSAGQKGTGRWTVIEAVTLGQSANVIEAAVAARAWSSERVSRAKGEALYAPDRAPVTFTDAQLEAALLAGRIVSYAQGFRILAEASQAYAWSLDMARIAEVWRAGCIIRSALLADIASAYRSDLPEGEMIFAPAFVDKLGQALPHLRHVVATATAAGHPVAALSSALAFMETLTQARGTTDLVQAQRDFFGRHGFARLDGQAEQQGSYHGPWWD